MDREGWNGSLEGLWLDLKGENGSWVEIGERFLAESR